MSTIVGIFAFVNMINLMISSVEHEKCFIIRGKIVHKLLKYMAIQTFPSNVFKVTQRVFIEPSGFSLLYYILDTSSRKKNNIVIAVDVPCDFH